MDVAKIKTRGHAVRTDFGVGLPVVLRCKTCKNPVSAPLQRLNYAPDEPQYDPLAPISSRVPQGFYFIERGDFVVHLDDVRQTLALPDHGCCGRAGLDGRNTTCANRHEVGTEQSDCCQSPAMIFDGARVSPVPQSPVPQEKTQKDRSK